MAHRLGRAAGGGMKDPGHISLAAWNQEAPYRDADGYDLEQDQRWDYVAGSDYVPRELFIPTRTSSPGAVPAPTVRRRNSPLDPAGSFPAGSTSS